MFATPQITGSLLFIVVSRCGDTIHSFIELRNLNKITNTFTFPEFSTCPLATNVDILRSILLTARQTERGKPWDFTS
jgi:hypothetical protein